MWYRFCASICLVLGLLPFAAFAQTSGSSLLLSPEFPNVGETFTLKLSGFFEAGTSVSWKIDGVLNESFDDAQSITLSATEKKTTVVARVTPPRAPAFDVKKVVSPQRIDLLISADTMVPPFYAGRSLGSSGSTIRATALVFPQNSNYSYIWHVGGRAQNGGLGYSSNSLAFRTGFENEAVVTVTVVDSSGAIVGKKSEVVPLIEPELYFYEKNPLRGLSWVALKNPHIFIGEELTARAEGYFVGRELVGEEVVREWKVNNRTVAAEGDPMELTIRKEGNSGSARISFSMLNLKQLLQGVEKTFSVQF